MVIGERFGMWVVLAESGRNKQYHRMVECLCDCGNIKRVNIENLKRGGSKSCGCQRGEEHGKSSTNTYFVWQAMKARCSNPSNKQWADYGGRGIAVCPEWKNSFETFLSDMGDCPEKYCIDRIDNDKGYGPDNCKWVTRLENNSNKRNTILLEYNGEKLPLKTWANKIGMNHSTLRKRILLKKWDVDRAFNEPVTRAKALSF